MNYAVLLVVGRTLVNMETGTIRRVPEWVPRSRLVVAAAEDFLLWLFGETGSPETLGSRVSLAWVGGIHPTSPTIGQSVEASKRRAITEFMIADLISAGAPYPGAAWFGERGIPADSVPSAEFWEVHIGYASTRSHAHGIALAVGWVLGVIDELTYLTPVHWEDGTPLSDVDRQACANVLHAISVRPLPPPTRPQLSRNGSRRGPPRAGLRDIGCRSGGGCALPVQPG